MQVHPSSRSMPSTACGRGPSVATSPRQTIRSEEHTSELQSLRHLVCRLLLEKKKKKNKKNQNSRTQEHQKDYKEKPYISQIITVSAGCNGEPYRNVRCPADVRRQTRAMTRLQ